MEYINHKQIHIYRPVKRGSVNVYSFIRLYWDKKYTLIKLTKIK